MRLACLLLAATAAVLTCPAYAQTPTLKPLPRVMPGKLVLNMAQPYTAQLGNPLFSGQVSDGAVTWACSKGVCRTQATWPAPAVAACAALAAKAGRLTRFGNARASLDEVQLAACNGNPGVSTTRILAPTVLAPATRNPVGGKAALFDALRRKREAADAQAAAEAAARRDSHEGMVRYAQGDDCNDMRRDVNPNASETCDGHDNNCDGAIDEGQRLLFFLDADGDGHGDPAQRMEGCPYEQRAAAESGRWLVFVGNDCNDADPSLWTGCP
ncbi:MAG: hypothetical protein A3E01_06185 [Gammaproteobacteria bacterium RIFCSPHIGHO2_12_FULL_63_22]|nr:MAG: hypothetical protein A3E01_06185 [Gammaproteobacteria bacterium RIFCSPHIGHO2_12_FULL_63_22]